MAYLCKMFKIYVRENVSNVKEEKDQTTRPCHNSPSVSSVFETKRRKFMAYCGVGPLIAAKFKKFKWLKPHKSVNNNKKLKITPIYSSNIPSFNVCFSKYCKLCCLFPCSFNCCSLKDVFSSRVSWDREVDYTCSCSVHSQKASHHHQCAFACVVLGR